MREEGRGQNMKFKKFGGEGNVYTAVYLELITLESTLCSRKGVGMGVLRRILCTIFVAYTCSAITVFEIVLCTTSSDGASSEEKL